MSSSDSFAVPGSFAKAKNSNVPIGHLDYSYVKDCTNAKELEDIISVLRSGSEGYYPDLVEFTEKKLKEINPKSEVLRKNKPAPSVKDLDDDDKKIVTEDFLDWMNKANDMDKELKTSNAPTDDNCLPPIRSKKTIVDTNETKNNPEKSNSANSTKRAKPRDYKEWDKFDIDKELENVDKKEESAVEPKLNDKKSKIEPLPDIRGLDSKERSFRALKEKEKGNEAFRAQDYEEAIVYYTNSLKYEKTAASYNNRAAAELKIEKYSEAIGDCNKVLEFESNNLKAFVRRGMAYKALKLYEMAKKDFNSMLEIDPNNKRAKELLADIESLKTKNDNTKMKTKNLTSTNEDGKLESTEHEKIAGAETKKKGQRLIIEEIDNSNNVIEGDCAVLGSGDKLAERDLGTSKDISEDYVVIDKDKIEHERTTMDKIGIVVKETEAKEGVEAETEPIESKKEKIVLQLPENVKNLMGKGNSLYKMGHHSEALEKYSKCVEILWPDRESYVSAVSSLLNNKAACYFKMGDCKQCVSECNQSLELIDDNVKALCRRGLAYETMEKYAEAFRDFNRARLIDGSNKLAQEHCSRAIKHLEMLHGKSWRKKIFEMNNADDSKHQMLPDVNSSSQNTSKVGEVKDSDNKNVSMNASPQPESSLNAGEIHNSVTELNEEESGASIKARFLELKESGNSLVKKGKHEEAIKHYTDCIKLCPEEVAIYTNRALCYLNLTKFDLAEADCNTALKIQAENVKALFRRAKARKNLGRYREASEDLIHVLKLDTKNGAARSELTTVLDLLKKERLDGKETSIPDRKKILIQDIDGEKDSSKVAQKGNVKTNKSSLKVEEKENAKTTEASSNGNTHSQCSSASIKYNLKSAFQFLQAWKSVKSAPEYLNILKQINVTDLPKLLSNKLDADIMKSIFEALRLEIKSNGDIKFVYQFLQSLMSVQRFEMSLMFLSTLEKEALRKLFDDIAKQNEEQIETLDTEKLSQLRLKYQV